MNKTALALSLVELCLVACSSATIPAGVDSDSGSPSNDGGTSKDSMAETGSDSGASLEWYTTCGYPVCGEPDGDAGDAGNAGCPEAGTACTKMGETCGTPDKANCGSTFLCDDHDPKGPHGDECPVSSRSYKDGIQYVDDNDLVALHDDALRVRLATYNYKANVADPNQAHIGFIIEDMPESVAVNRTLNRVDLYGYVSMAIAGMQVQEKEIAALRGELENTRKEVAACRRGQR